MTQNFHTFYTTNEDGIGSGLSVGPFQGASRATRNTGGSDGTRTRGLPRVRAEVCWEIQVAVKPAFRSSGLRRGMRPLSFLAAKLFQGPNSKSAKKASLMNDLVLSGVEDLP